MASRSGRCGDWAVTAGTGKWSLRVPTGLEVAAGGVNTICVLRWAAAGSRGSSLVGVSSGPKTSSAQLVSTVEGVEAVEIGSGIRGVAGDLMNVVGLRNVVGTAVVLGSGRVFSMSFLGTSRLVGSFLWWRILRGSSSITGAFGVVSPHTVSGWRDTVHDGVTLFFFFLGMV